MWWFIGGFVTGFIVGVLSLAVAQVKQQQRAAKDEASVG